MTTICLRLYVTGHTVSAQKARVALAELEQRMVTQRGPGAIVSEVIDVLETPEIAAREDIFATPTLVRLSPGPSLKVFGDLSSVRKLIDSLELEPQRPGTLTHGLSAPALAVADRLRTGEDTGPWPATISDTSSSPAATRE